MADDDERRAPLGVTTDDDTPKKGFVQVTAVIPKLEVKKGLFGKEAKVKNGSVDASFKEQSLRIDLDWRNQSGSTEKFRIIYRKLPDKILPDECSYKLKAGKVIIQLRKADDRSWARELSSTGLETEDPNET